MSAGGEEVPVALDPQQNLVLTLVQVWATCMVQSGLLLLLVEVPLMRYDV